MARKKAGAAKPRHTNNRKASTEQARPKQQADRAPATETSIAVDSPAWWEEEPVTSQTAVSELPEQADDPFAPPVAIEAEPEALPLHSRDNEAIHSDDAHLIDLDDGTRPLTKTDQPLLAAQRSRLGFSAAALRDIGRVRSANQDSLFAMITTVPREGNDISIGLFIVADGMGGHSGGEIASHLAISTVVQHVLAEMIIPALNDGYTEAIQPLIISSVQEANRAIWEQGQATGSDMGTTCTVALVLGRGLYIGHVGDSRAYLVTPTGMRQMTTDHSTVGRLIQLGQLDPSEARDHPLRSQLYRTIGQTPEVMVDFIYQPIGDATHLLLGSDGLWGMLDDELLLDVLESHVWPQDACRELVARANLAGGEDNISAVVISLPSV